MSVSSTTCMKVIFVRTILLKPQCIQPLSVVVIMLIPEVYSFANICQLAVGHSVLQINRPRTHRTSWPSTPRCTYAQTQATSIAHSMVLSNHISVSYRNIHSAACLSISDGENTIWAMQRDLCDEWLDEVLIQRSSKDESGSGDLPSIFKTASLVVENCLSVATETEASTINTPSLRRVPYDGIDSTYISDDHCLWAEKMFTPLFGTPNDDILCPSSTASADTVRQAIKRTSKKNRVRTNLKITVAYRGLDFCGWEDQRHELYRKKTRGQDTTTTREINGETSSAADQQTLPSVQGTLLDILDPVLNRRADDDDEIENEASLTMKRFQQKRRVNTKPLEIKVAGRTDRGVSAIAQVCRVRTWKEIDGIETYVKSVVNEDMANGNVGLRITNVESVGGDFHPSFGATCRSYAYLIDLDMDDEKGHSSVDLCESTRPTISRSIVPKLDRMLRAIEGNELDYYAFSHGKVKTQTTLCTLHHARAGIVEWTGDSDDTSLAQKRQALCFELVGNRFLRRMVRILVATALREAYRDDAPRDALLKILSSKDRKQRSRASPPDGLIFVGAEFEPSKLNQ